MTGRAQFGAESGIDALSRLIGSRASLIAVLSVVAGIQLISTFFFLYVIISDLFMTQWFIIPWGIQELLEVFSAIGMLLGVVMSLLLIYFLGTRANRLDGQVRAVAGDFQKFVEKQFDQWQLTQTERHVAILVMKGFSNSEISRMRGTTESTVKSQLTSIFRKTGLTSRQQLTTHMIEDILDSITTQA